MQASCFSSPSSLLLAGGQQDAYVKQRLHSWPQAIKHNPEAVPGIQGTKLQEDFDLKARISGFLTRLRDQMLPVGLQDWSGMCPSYMITWVHRHGLCKWCREPSKSRLVDKSIEVCRAWPHEVYSTNTYHKQMLLEANASWVFVSSQC